MSALPMGFTWPSTPHRSRPAIRAARRHGADRNAKLTDEQKKALPGLANLLGAPLPSAPAVVGDNTLQKITIGSATCGARHDGGDGPAPASDEAPRPEVVQANLPVTG